MKFKYFVIVFVLLLSMTKLFAQRTVADNAIVGASDLVVAGTITAVTDSPLSTSANNGGTPGSSTDGSWGSIKGVMKNISFTVEEAVLGKITTKQMTVSVPTYSNQKTDWLPAVGDVKLFCLQRSRDGYSLTYAQSGILAVEKIEELDKLVKAMPISFTLASPEKPLFFSQMTPIAITVTNLTETPLNIRNINLGGFFYAKRMESYISFTVTIPSNPVEAVEVVRQISLAGKEKKQLNLLVAPRTPQSMALLGEDSYMITSSAIYGQLSYSTDNTNWLNVRSNWQDAYIGYGLKPDVEVEVVENK